MTLSPLWGVRNRRHPTAAAVGDLHRNLLLSVYAAVVFVAASAVFTELIATGHGVGSVPTVLVLAILALYAEAQPVQITPALQFSVATTLVTFAAVLLGPVAAVLVVVGGMLIDLRPRDTEQPLLRWLVWTSGRALTAAVAGLAVIAIGGPHPTQPQVLLAAVAVASTVDVIVGDLLLSPVPAVIRGSSSWFELVRMIAPMQLSALPVQMPLIALLAYVYLHVSPWGLTLFVVPAFAAQRLYLLYRQQREASDELKLANEKLGAASLSFATALVATLEARDRYTAGHSAAVAIYARDIAVRLGLSEGEQQKAHLCGLVHDIGKVGLPPALLEKRGPLTLDERRQMQQHAEIGERILAKVDNYTEIARIVRHHHERFDGAGYPDRLSGDDIPLISRIIAVADAYNAMTSDRPYRDAMPPNVARIRLARAVGSQFDTAVVAAFEAVLAAESESYCIASRDDFRLESHGASHTSIAGPTGAVGAMLEPVLVAGSA
jgi:putative nucleotidyltransferase with HDIG domain